MVEYLKLPCTGLLHKTVPYFENTIHMFAIYAEERNVMKEGNKRHLAHDLLNVWLVNPHAYDIRTAVKVFPTLTTVALEHLESRSSSFRTNPHQMTQLVDALAMDKRKGTARAILNLFNRGRLSGAWLTGAAFEQINWTLGGGPPDSAQGSQGRSNDEREGRNPI